MVATRVIERLRARTPEAPAATEPGDRELPAAVRLNLGETADRPQPNLVAPEAPPAAIRGVVALDGAGYDVPQQLRDAGPMLRTTYQMAFGDDPVRQRALSPTVQAAAPNAPAFLLAHVDRPVSAAQAGALGAALRQAGAEVQIAAFAGKGLQGHIAINRSLGDPDYPATAVVDAWLAKILAR